MKSASNLQRDFFVRVDGLHSATLSFPLYENDEFSFCPGFNNNEQSLRFYVS